MSEIRVLLIEDSENDALLITRHLKQNGFDLDYRRVESINELNEALKDGKWDVVLSDYVLPRMNGLDAFRIVKNQDPDLPFIIVSGNIGEEIAVEAMRSGVHDYILKDNLVRLVPALNRELKESRLRHRHRVTQDDLERTREEVERQKRHKQEMLLLSNLVSGVAHEIRNPLNAITALIEALFQELGDNEISEAYRPYLNTQVERINRLMKNLLELGRVSGVESYTTFDFVKLCRAVADKWNSGGENTHVELVHRLSKADARPFVKGDYNRLKQVLLSIVENASYFSPEGSSVTMEFAVRNGKGVVSVRDKGPGIKSEHMNRIFDPFFTTRKAGTGLGLGIARRVIESHYGTMEISNNYPPPGCTVRIALPLIKDD
ncbi:MAG: ATP-binding protein [Chitinispirillaceae bacterium]